MTNSKEYNKQYYQNHKEKWKEYREQWNKNNSTKVKMANEKWRINNPEKIRGYEKRYQRKKYKINLNFKLNNRIRIAIGFSLKGNKKGQRWEDLVGYTLEDLKKHLQKTLPISYIWQDYMTGRLHVDHIVPISAFNFSKPEHTDFKRCWALDNLQLLPAKENRSKHNKLSKPFQPTLGI